MTDFLDTIAAAVPSLKSPDLVRQPDPDESRNFGEADLTQYELQALAGDFNLADAHTHQSQSSSQQAIVERLPQLWFGSEKIKQATHDRRFIEAFFSLHDQPTAMSLNRTVLTYSASVSTMIIGMYLARTSQNVALIEPCFDNLPDLLLKLGVSVASVSESSLAQIGQDSSELDALESDAIYLVDPNNPTGFTTFGGRPSRFEQLADYCRNHGKILIVDACFAAFALGDYTYQRRDVYDLLESREVSYLIVEDTGKVWPTQDVKCSLLTASKDLFPAVHEIYTAVQLNVSPFVLNLLTHYIKDSIEDGMMSIRSVCDVNRATLIKAMQTSGWIYQEPMVPTSVAWFKLPDGSPKASVLQHELRGGGVHVLPGEPFYWDHSDLGERYVRVALARSPDEFARSAARLRSLMP